MLNGLAFAVEAEASHELDIAPDQAAAPIAIPFFKNNLRFIIIYEGLDNQFVLRKNASRSAICCWSICSAKPGMMDIFNPLILLMSCLLMVFSSPGDILSFSADEVSFKIIPCICHPFFIVTSQVSNPGAIERLGSRMLAIKSFESQLWTDPRSGPNATPSAPRN